MLYVLLCRPRKSVDWRDKFKFNSSSLAHRCHSWRCTGTLLNIFFHDLQCHSSNGFQITIFSMARIWKVSTRYNVNSVQVAERIRYSHSTRARIKTFVSAPGVSPRLFLFLNKTENRCNLFACPKRKGNCSYSFTSARSVHFILDCLESRFDSGHATASVPVYWEM